jgi:hypothetical protein
VIKSLETREQSEDNTYTIHCHTIMNVFASGDLKIISYATSGPNSDQGIDIDVHHTENTDEIAARIIKFIALGNKIEFQYFLGNYSTQETHGYKKISNLIANDMKKVGDIMWSFRSVLIDFVNSDYGTDFIDDVFGGKMPDKPELLLEDSHVMRYKGTDTGYKNNMSDLYISVDTNGKITLDIGNDEDIEIHFTNGERTEYIVGRIVSTITAHTDSKIGPAFKRYIDSLPGQKPRILPPPS